MGTYLNPDNEVFCKMVNSEIYVDKTGMLQYTNKVVNTMQGCLCVSRPRRFGKSMAAAMLAAYYSCGCDSEALFSPFAIAQSQDFKKYLNKYDTIFLNMQEFLSQSKDMEEMLALIQKSVLWELLEKYPGLRYFDTTNLARTMQDMYAATRRPFVIIIDEWDCIFREYKTEKAAQERYLDFLRNLIKDKGYIHLAYMTGILPIKKYGTHSALNMFDEFTMLEPGPLASYVGFTEREVEELCRRYAIDMEEVKNWYDGYSFETEPCVYSPRSVISCMRLGKIGNYWNQTESFEALQTYIDLNFDGLKDDILSMLAGERIPVNTGSFINDMATFRTEDDVLTLLIHLGYLAYDDVNKCVFIPNDEVRSEYVNAVSVSDWGEISKALKNSADTLAAIWDKRPALVAERIQEAHFETSHIQYNDENALSYTISLALYAARNFYTVHREWAGGKGFADLVFLPRKRFPEKPALVVELKWDQSAAGALEQIKRNEYCKSLSEYHGNLLLVGINYNKKTKEHECIIEENRK
ncbi:MAG: AAA family ATPase [Lachnospiraceae bacterium]|nr:AAA family ATPase [Lachnospiraceae bacterium]